MPIVLSGSYTKFYNQLASPVSQSFATVGTTKFSNYDLMNFAHGNFSRTSSGSLILGNTASLAWSNPTVRRIEDRGDGLFPLFEGQRENLIPRNRELTNAAWNLQGFRSASSDGPDGTTAAGTYVTTSIAQFGTILAAGNALTNSNYALSAYVRSLSSITPWAMSVAVGALNQCYGGRFGSTNTTWSRQDSWFFLVGPQTLHTMLGNGIAIAEIGPGVSIPELARSGVYDLVQLEVAQFPSTPIATIATAASRSSDILTFHAGDVPADIRNGVFSFDILPYFSNTETTSSVSASQNIYTLLSFGANDYLAISGSKLFLTASTGFAMSGALTSSIFSWNRHQKVTVTVDTISGVIQTTTVSGSSLANFIPWAWPVSGLQIGAMSGTNAFPFFGRLSNFRKANRLPGLDLFAGGTFTRSTEASYLTTAAPNGPTPFLSWAPVNVRRIENRGDGSGDMLLMEAARTNQIVQSRAMQDAAWSGGTTTDTANALAGPDGAVLATRVVATAGQFSRNQTIAGTGMHALSCWARAVSGTTPHQLYIGGTNANARSIGTTYERRISTGSIAASPSAVVPEDARDLTVYGGQVATAQDAYVDLHQFEVGGFASSPIRTTTVAVTRAADFLSYADGQYPARFRTNGFRIHFAFDCTDTELVNNGTAFYLWSFGAGTHTTRLDINRIIYVDSGGGGVSAFTGVTFSRGQLLTLEVRPSAGTVTLTGATAGNGTHTRAAWAYPSSSFVVGSSNGTFGIFGRMKRYIEAL